MALKRRTRNAQTPLVAEIVFSYNDGMAQLSDLNGASVDDTVNAIVTDFGSGVQPEGLLPGTPYSANTGGLTKYFELIRLPYGAQVIGGDVQVEDAYVGPATATLALGDAASGTRYLAATDIKAAARTALTIPNQAGAGSVAGAFTGADVRATLALGAGAATAGRVRVRVMYTLDGRATEIA